MAEIVHPRSMELVKKRITQLNEGKAVDAVEELFIRLDGQTVQVEAAASPIRYQGKPATLVMARDISERKHAEELLRRMMTHAKCILWDADVEGLPGWEEETDGTTSRFDWRINVRDADAAQEVLPLE